VSSLIRTVAISAQLAVLLVLRSPVALGGPPFVTDDPVPTAYRTWEIYSGLQYENEMDGATLIGAPFLALNYGALPNVQVSLSTALGNGGTQFGIKTRFVQEAKGWPQIAFYPSVALPTNAGEHAVPFLPLWAQESWGPWTVFGGGGVFVNRGAGQRDDTLAGIAIERDVSHTVSVGGELYHQSAATIGGTDTTALNLGAIAQLGEHHAVLFSAGRGLHGEDAFSAYASYEFVLGPK